MYTGLLHLHSALRWVVLILLVAATLRFLIGWFAKHSFGKGDEKLRLFTLISAHLQLVIGLVLYFISPAVQFNDKTMENDSLRFWSLEHILMMILAIVCITVGHSISKRKEEATAKHRILAIMFTLALVLIFSAIPWPWRAEIGRPLF